MSTEIQNRIKANKRSSSKKGPQLRYAVTEMKGWRSEMEDAHCAVQVPQIPGWWFFGVFDGHGGDYCSRHASEKLWDDIFEQLEKSCKTNSTEFDKLSEQQVIGAIKEGFFEFDKKLREKAVVPDTDSSYLYPTFVDKSGTTVIACLMTTKHIYLINCGDSRGILVRQPSKLELVTFDHKPSQLKEKQRIQNAGGMIALNRVNGGLATSRGLGDFEYKCVPELLPHQQFVSPEPDFYVIDRNPSLDHFVVLACDGVWDVKKSEEVVKFVSEKINAEDLAEVTNEFVDSCFDAGSKDNISVILIHFQHESSNHGSNENSGSATSREKLPKIPSANGTSTKSASTNQKGSQSSR